VRPSRASALLLLLLVVALTLAAAPPPSVAPPGPARPSETGPWPQGRETPAVRAMVANVGNVSPHCAEQAFSLCLLPVERRVAAGLADASPDVVALIEVLPAELCDGITPRNPANSCRLATQDPPQVMRLLAHDDHDVVCADRYAWDCLAVRSAVGSIAGCGGGDCGAIAPTLPAPAGCDDGFQSFVVDVELHGRPLTVGVAHPNSSDVGCRAQELRDLFAALPDDREVLLLGDFNLDPFRERDASVDVWDEHVGEGHRLRLLSGPSEHDPPYFTLFPFESAQVDPTGSLPVNVELGDLAGARTIDHVVASAGLTGACTTLGEAPGSERLEGPRGGLDHRAVRCEVAPATPPVPPRPRPSIR
jgi:hypothetical protein